MYNQLFTKDIIVIYHGNCTDGTSAAWCFSHMMKTDPNPWIGVDIEFWPADHGSQNVPERLKGRTVIMLDFTYTTENMLKIIEEAHVTIVLDHHDTATERLSACDHYKICGKLHYILDLTRSGCQIAWDTFHPKEKRPWFLDYIADRDLWKWELPHSKEVTAALYNLYEHDKITTYEKLWNDSLFLPNHKETFIKQGRTCLVYQESIIKKLKTSAVPMMMKKHRVLVASCPWMFRSDLGNALAEEDDVAFAALYTFVPPKFDQEKKESIPGYYSFSLRGVKEKGIKLNEIAEQYGGGGHPLACGFRWNGKLEDLMTPCK